MRTLVKKGENSRTETTKRAVIAMSGRCGAPTAASVAAVFVHARQEVPHSTCDRKGEGTIGWVGGIKSMCKRR